MTFFDPIVLPQPRFKEEARPMPWQEGLGKTVITDVIVGERPDGALLLRNLIAFPKVMTLSVVAWLHHPLVEGPGTRGHNSPTFGRWIADDSISTGVVMFGLRFSDGTCYRNLDARGSAGHLGSLRGSGGGFTGDHEFWAPLPTAGDLEIFAAWPAAQIPETRTVVDASLVRDTAAALLQP